MSLPMLEAQSPVRGLAEVSDSTTPPGACRKAPGALEVQRDEMTYASYAALSSSGAARVHGKFANEASLSCRNRVVPPGAGRDARRRRPYRAVDQGHAPRD